MYLKSVSLILVTLFSISSFAGEKEVIVARTKIGFRTKIDSYIRGNKLNRVYALVATKKDRRGINGCSIHRGTMSTKKCRVTTEKVRIHELSINSNNEIIFSKDGSNVVCGYVKETWLGRRTILNNNCALVDVEEVIEEDDGVDIYDVKYNITKFIVKE